MIMDNIEEDKVLDQLKVLYVRGTNYEVGLSVGRTFKGEIQENFANWDFFNTVLLKNYSTTGGKQIYDATFRLCEKRFPQYINELKGLAEGSEVPFYKVFLAHIDSLATPASEDIKNEKIQADSGCTSILCNNSEVILAQNEDGFPVNVNRIFVVVADIIDINGHRVEKFSALTYPGMLPGVAMGFNHNGIAFAVNTLVPKETFSNGSPRFFITRALLSAANHDQILKIISDEGSGVNDGFNINICYMSNDKKLSATTEMYSIEVAPPKLSDITKSERKSQVSVKAIPSGESYVHCNRYLHLVVPEKNEYLSSSICRHEVISKLPVPSTMAYIKNTLSDQSVSNYPVYRRCQTGEEDGAKTVATGIFDIRKREWSIYMHPPARSEPTAVISMNL